MDQTIDQLQQRIEALEACIANLADAHMVVCARGSTAEAWRRYIEPMIHQAVACMQAPFHEET